VFVAVGDEVLVTVTVMVADGAAVRDGVEVTVEVGTTLGKMAVGEIAVGDGRVVLMNVMAESTGDTCALVVFKESWNCRNRPG